MWKQGVKASRISTTSQWRPWSSTTCLTATTWPTGSAASRAWASTSKCHGLYGVHAADPHLVQVRWSRLFFEKNCFCISLLSGKSELITSTKMAALMPLCKLHHPFQAHLKLLIVIQLSVFIEIKNPFWFLSYGASNKATFQHFFFVRRNFRICGSSL